MKIAFETGHLRHEFSNAKHEDTEDTTAWKTRRARKTRKAQSLERLEIQYTSKKKDLGYGCFAFPVIALYESDNPSDKKLQENYQYQPICCEIKFFSAEQTDSFASLFDSSGFAYKNSSI